MLNNGSYVHNLSLDKKSKKWKNCRNDSIITMKKKLIWSDLNLSDTEFLRQKNVHCFMKCGYVLFISFIPS